MAEIGKRVMKRRRALSADMSEIGKRVMKRRAAVSAGERDKRRKFN
jgi:hypothetical protein